MKAVTRILHTSAFLALVSTASVLAGEASPDVIARVGEQDITVADVRPLLDALSPADQAALEANPSALNEYVRTIILQQLILKKALSAGWDKNSEIAPQLERLRQSALAQTYLDSQSAIPADYPASADLQAAYEANKAALLVPRQLHLAQIFIATPPNGDKAATDKAKARAEAVRKTLGQPSVDFAAVARAQSDEAQSAAQDGEIGWLTEAQLQPEIRDALTEASAGAIAGPIRLGDGWHIIKVLEIKAAYTPSLEEASDLLTRQLRTARAKTARDAYLQGLLRENPISLNELAVTKLVEKKAD